MNKVIASLFIMILAVSIQAQSGRESGRDGMEQRIEAKKVSYLTDQLDLTPEDAQVFWPVYNLYTKEIKELRENNRSISESEASADEKLEQMIQGERQKLSITEKYMEKFSQLIGAEKTIKLFESERGFKREMLRGMKKRRERESKKRKEKEMKKKYKEGK